MVPKGVLALGLATLVVATALGGCLAEPGVEPMDSSSGGSDRASEDARGQENDTQDTYVYELAVQRTLKQAFWVSALGAAQGQGMAIEVHHAEGSVVDSVEVRLAWNSTSLLDANGRVRGETDGLATGPSPLTLRLGPEDDNVSFVSMSLYTDAGVAYSPEWEVDVLFTFTYHEAPSAPPSIA